VNAFIQVLQEPATAMCGVYAQLNTGILKGEGPGKHRKGSNKTSGHCVGYGDQFKNKLKPIQRQLMNVLLVGRK